MLYLVAMARCHADGFGPDPVRVRAINREDTAFYIICQGRMHVLCQNYCKIILFYHLTSVSCYVTFMSRDILKGRLRMIYFIQQGKTGAIKIGYTSKDDVRDRLLTLQVGSAESLHVIGVMEGDQKQEKLLHQLFKPYHMKGEWFESSPKLYMYIMSLITGRDIAPTPDHRSLNGLSLNQYVKQFETDIIQSTLKTTQGNVTEAAKQLGITFRQLRHRISKYKIDRASIK